MDVAHLQTHLVPNVHYVDSVTSSNLAFHSLLQVVLPLPYIRRSSTKSALSLAKEPSRVVLEMETTSSGVNHVEVQMSPQ